MSSARAFRLEPVLGHPGFQRIEPIPDGLNDDQQLKLEREAAWEVMDRLNALLDEHQEGVRFRARARDRLWGLAVFMASFAALLGFADYLGPRLRAVLLLTACCGLGTIMVLSLADLWSVMGLTRRVLRRDT